jgi:ribosomal protein L11 methyltransferase
MRPSASSASAAFACIQVRLECSSGAESGAASGAASGAEMAERVAAEAYAAGAVGLEERENQKGVTLLLYARAGDAETVRRAVELVGVPAPVVEVVAVPDADWSEAWKADLEATVVSPRLVVRPSFVSFVASSARQPEKPAEIVVDPGQAFGTGGHPSTRLALEWIDRLAPALEPGARILDVGTGTGVLALAALRLSGGVGSQAVALDIDPLASAAALANAEVNGLAARFHVFTGPLAALRREPREGRGAFDLAFDLVVANLLRTEMLPLLGEISQRMRPGANAVLSGLLASERGSVEAAAGAVGLAAVGARYGDDDSGERWAALLTLR